MRLAAFSEQLAEAEPKSRCSLKKFIEDETLNMIGYDMTLGHMPNSTGCYVIAKTDLITKCKGTKFNIRRS